MSSILRCDGSLNLNFLCSGVHVLKVKNKSILTLKVPFLFLFRPEDSFIIFGS